MATKAVLAKQNSLNYPKYMHNGDLIVLFFKPHVGTLIQGPYNDPIHHTNWNMDGFVDIPAGVEIVVSNVEG